MEINGIAVTKNCMHCDCFIPVESKNCPYCEKDTTNVIPEKLIPLTITDVISLLNEAFFRLESFANGALGDYQYFGFSGFFSKLFLESKKLENFTYFNCTLIGNYWCLCQQLREDFDKADFKNKSVFDNEGFCDDCYEISCLAWERIGEFCEFITQDELANAEKKFSIADILKAKNFDSGNMDAKQKGILKAKDYISFYGQISQFPVYWNFTKSKLSKAQFIEQNPEYELNEYELEAIYSNERFSLSKYLKLFTDETELIKIFRLLFDEYREQGGDPLKWLYFTFEYISLNPQSFPAQHRGIIEKNLIQWIDNFTKQPFDLLGENIKDINAKDKGEVQNYLKIEGPAFGLFCSIVHQSGFEEIGFDEGKEKYCQRISTLFNIHTSPKKARQFFAPMLEIRANDKRFKKVVDLILPNIPTDAKQIIETFLNTKTKLYG
ncbi:hypothetical protein [Ferruginibacter profundus]